MRIIATILCIYFAGLLLQPVLYNLHSPQAKVMSCCAKKAGKMHKGCPMQKNQKGCCDNGNCNPLCTECPICGFTAITSASYYISYPDRSIALKEQYFLRNWFLLSNYQADLLRPPQSV